MSCAWSFPNAWLEICGGICYSRNSRKVRILQFSEGSENGSVVCSQLQLAMQCRELCCVSGDASVVCVAGRISA